MTRGKLLERLFVLASMLALVLICSIAGSEGREKADPTKCRLKFSVQGWSVFYETASGSGSISCDNGKSAQVRIRVKGGGLTAGKSKLSGHGTFSEVSDIRELFGAYAKAEAHAGVVKSADAQVLTKGSVSLTLTATGSGVDLGIAFGKFTIEPAGKKGAK
ncbi:MAG: hypothetical protein ACLPX5_16330 [Dissulfurispiraceae bacterium]